MKSASLTLGALILLLLVAVIPVPGGLQADALYYSPVFMALLLLLSLLSVRCCLRRKAGLKQVGFYLVHLSVVLILIGAFVGYLFGVKGMLKLSLKPSVAIDHLTGEKRESIPFGFAVSAEDFHVEFYPPVYQLYLPVSPEDVTQGQMPFRKAGEFNADGRAFWSFEGMGRFAVSNLWNEARQEWVPQQRLADGSLLHLAGQTPKFYGVTLRIGDQTLPVSINHPAQYKGWRFYLMSYDQKWQRYVHLSVRRDPGRIVVIAGIWLAIIGTFILCFRKTGGSQ